MPRTLWVLAVFAGLAVVPLPGQSQQPPAPGPAQPPPTFKVEVNYVEIDARVTDAQDKFIGDLTKDDFQLLDDGKPQDISAFSLVDIPMPSASARPICGGCVTPPARRAGRLAPTSAEWKSRTSGSSRT